MYVLRCADGSYYTGITNDLARRLAAHRAGKASKYTRGRLPIELAGALGAWPSRGEALRYEAWIKGLPRHRKQALFREEGGIARRLSPP